MHETISYYCSIHKKLIITTIIILCLIIGCFILFFREENKPVKTLGLTDQTRIEMDKKIINYACKTTNTNKGKVQVSLGGIFVTCPNGKKRTLKQLPKSLSPTENSSP